jgi:hypothetical protein
MQACLTATCHLHLQQQLVTSQAAQQAALCGHSSSSSSQRLTVVQLLQGLGQRCGAASRGRQQQQQLELQTSAACGEAAQHSLAARMQDWLIVTFQLGLELLARLSSSSSSLGCSCRMAMLSLLN